MEDIIMIIVMITGMIVKPVMIDIKTKIKTLKE